MLAVERVRCGYASPSDLWHCAQAFQPHSGHLRYFIDTILDRNGREIQFHLSLLVIHSTASVDTTTLVRVWSQ